MELIECFNSAIENYSRFYDIEKNLECCDGFFAIATFNSREENYILSRRSVVYAYEQYEYVYFAVEDFIDEMLMKNLLEKSLELGLAKIKPNKEHMRSLVTLVVIANRIDKNAKKMLKKSRFSKSYKFTFHGWMQFRVAALEISTNELSCNSPGKDVLKVFSKGVKE